MKLKVTGERVAIKPDELPEMNSEGTLFTPWARKRSTMMGTVVAVGDGPHYLQMAVEKALKAAADAVEGFQPEVYDRVANLVDEYVAPDHSVRVGDRVIFSPESGEEVICERSLYVFMKETDILAVVG